VFCLRVSPAFAVDEAEFACNGSSGTTCDVFQLDGADTATPNADTCVGTENGCPSEESPVWPADWDGLVYPSSFGITSTFTTNSNVGSGAGAGTFTLPWGQVGSFSGIFTSSLVSTGTSTILKQGSKNGNDVSTWVVASQSSPPKDAFLAATLATYVGPPGQYGGHELLYHAATRISPNGSATEGIWLFQENVQACASGTALCVGNTTTLAQHKKGDVFLFITYSGSGTATIQAATWQGANGPAGFLGPAPGSIVLCPTANDDACAISNAQASITLGGPTGPQQPGTGFNVSGSGFAGFPGGAVPALQFQEGGIDLTTVLGGVPPCFSSVMFATVSSGSSPSTASLKAIVLGSFNTCAIHVSKACGTGTPTADLTAITYPISGAVTNVGGGAVNTLTLTDTFNNSAQAFDSGSLSCSCGSNCTGGPTCSSVQLNPGGAVTYSATITTTSNGGSDVVTATMAGVGGGSAMAQSNTATCLPRHFPDSISITKTCSPGASLVAQSGLVAVEVGVSGTVTNGSSSLPLSNVREFDCVNGTFGMLSTDANGCPVVPANYQNTCSGTLRTPTNPTTSSLSAGGSQAWSDSYFPSVPPSCGPYNFNDQVLVEASCTSQFCVCPTVVNVASQTCPLCPGPTCP